MAGRFLRLFNVFRGNRNTDPGAAQPPEEQEQFQPLQDDAAMDQTQEQEPARGRFHRAAQRFRKFLRIRHRRNTTAATEDTAEPDCRLTELQAEPDVSPDSAEHSQESDAAVNDERENSDKAVTEDVAIPNDDAGETQGIADAGITPTPALSQELIRDNFKDNCFSSEQQVPATVRNIYQSLVSCVTVDVRQQIDIIRLAEEHPADVVLTLLHCAPSCDRAAEMMWRAIGSSGPTVEKVLPTLLCVMEDWPLHSICTSDGDNKDVFALAVSSWSWHLITQTLLLQQLSILSLHQFLS
ncbi:uncharacterized protein LOC111944634 [Cyanistes caeruleus]|uniref:uncharacterized protein LOC111944634 n=1 Tax=Cyanistes caeruleus TaxID=156563 RepID=UPI000CDAC900|nr:uncharacterized protein LOC111944634 [Cyanistes caeruleus]